MHFKLWTLLKTVMHVVCLIKENIRELGFYFNSINDIIKQFRLEIDIDDVISEHTFFYASS